MQKQNQCMVCPGCNIEMNVDERYPVFLQCLHFFCFSCLESQKSKKEENQNYLNVKCYVCLKKQKINLMQVQNIKNSQQSFVNGNADKIKNKHQHFCKSHPDKRIKFYCDKEKTIFCLKCQPQHYDHIYKTKEFDPKELEDAIKNVITDFEDLDQTQVQEVQKLIENQENEQKNIEQKNKKLIDDVQKEREIQRNFLQNLTQKEISQKQRETLEKIKKLQEDSEKQVKQLEKQCQSDLLKLDGQMDSKIQNIVKNKKSKKLQEIKASIQKLNHFQAKINQQIKKFDQNLQNFINLKLDVIIEQFQSIKKFQIEHKICQYPKIYYDFDQLIFKVDQQPQDKQINYQYNNDNDFNQNILIKDALAPKYINLFKDIDLENVKEFIPNHKFVSQNPSDFELNDEQRAYYQQLYRNKVQQQEIINIKEYSFYDQNVPKESEYLENQTDSDEEVQHKLIQMSKKYSKNQN